LYSLLFLLGMTLSWCLYIVMHLLSTDFVLVICVIVDWAVYADYNVNTVIDLCVDVVCVRW